MDPLTPFFARPKKKCLLSLIRREERTALSPFSSLHFLINGSEKKVIKVTTPSSSFLTCCCRRCYSICSRALGSFRSSHSTPVPLSIDSSSSPVNINDMESFVSREGGGNRYGK